MCTNSVFPYTLRPRWPQIPTEHISFTSGSTLDEVSSPCPYFESRLHVNLHTLTWICTLFTNFYSFFFLRKSELAASDYLDVCARFLPVFSNTDLDCVVAAELAEETQPAAEEYATQ